MFRLITLISVLMVLGVQTKAQEIIYNKTIWIVNEKDTTIEYKPNDLVIIQGNGRYRIEYYFNEGKNVQYRFASVKSEKIFDQASYKKISDSAIAIMLFDSKTLNEFRFKVLWKDGGYAIGF